MSPVDLPKDTNSPDQPSDRPSGRSGSRVILASCWAALLAISAGVAVLFVNQPEVRPITRIASPLIPGSEVTTTIGTDKIDGQTFQDTIGAYESPVGQTGIYAEVSLSPSEVNPSNSAQRVLSLQVDGDKPYSCADEDPRATTRTKDFVSCREDTPLSPGLHTITATYGDGSSQRNSTSIEIKVGGAAASTSPASFGPGMSI